MSIALAGQMIRLAGKARSQREAETMALHALRSGAAGQRFASIIEAQGGSTDVMSNPDALPKAAHIQAVRAPSSGFVTRADARLLGQASCALGAGRTAVKDSIDPAVGLVLHAKTGDKVKQGDVLCDVHWNDAARHSAAIPLIEIGRAHV